MKNILCICLLLFALSSCDKTQYKLEGKWQMQQIESAEGINYNVDTIFYNFQSTLFSYQFYRPATDSYRQASGFRTMLSDDVMELEFAEPSDLEKNPRDFILYTDWEDLVREFRIVKLSRKTLILESEGKIYTLRSF
ncbi:MAG: lipocalin-like domain-containing protein [Tannerellaceae bacterium]|nr:lipocalin-like domain-containing protein [Tannerellaceae bacterium]